MNPPVIRPAQWPQDIPIVSELDIEFVTDRIYRLIHDEFSFRLEEEAVTPALRKRYDFDPSDPEERAAWNFAVIAEEDGQLAGFAAAEHLQWNNRINVRHIYVAPEFRRRGVGALLMGEVEIFARSVQARSLWLETQNINFPAIQFYRRLGFRLCGFDLGFYDPKSMQHNEIAVFFERPLSGPQQGQP